MAPGQSGAGPDGLEVAAHPDGLEMAPGGPAQVRQAHRALASRRSRSLVANGPSSNAGRA